MSKISGLPSFGFWQGWTVNTQTMVACVVLCPNVLSSVSPDDEQNKATRTSPCLLAVYCVWSLVWPFLTFVSDTRSRLDFWCVFTRWFRISRQICDFRKSWDRALRSKFLAFVIFRNGAFLVYLIQSPVHLWKRSKPLECLVFGCRCVSNCVGKRVHVGRGQRRSRYRPSNVIAAFQVDAKYLRNMRFSRKHNKSTAQQKKTFERRKVEGRSDKRPSLHWFIGNKYNVIKNRTVLTFRRRVREVGDRLSAFVGWQQDSHFDVRIVAPCPVRRLFLFWSISSGRQKGTIFIVMWFKSAMIIVSEVPKAIYNRVFNNHKTKNVVILTENGGLARACQKSGLGRLKRFSF